MAARFWLTLLLNNLVSPNRSQPGRADQCELYYVSRDTLFSFHRGSEAFLHRMVALYVSSHYKNSPDDLLLMSDAPAHQVGHFGFRVRLPDS